MPGCRRLPADSSVTLLLVSSADRPQSASPPAPLQPPARVTATALVPPLAQRSRETGVHGGVLVWRAVHCGSVPLWNLILN
eukprot:4724239-Prymnesium_polylepis.2